MRADIFRQLLDRLLLPKVRPSFILPHDYTNVLKYVNYSEEEYHVNARVRGLSGV